MCDHFTPRGRDKVRPECEAPDVNLKIKSAGRTMVPVAVEALVTRHGKEGSSGKITSPEGGF